MSELGIEVSLGAFNKQVPSPLPEKHIQSRLGWKVFQEALKESNHFVKTSVNYSAKYEDALPKIAASELEIGSLLGTGGFATVYEITSFDLHENHTKEKTQQTCRLFLKSHVYREMTGDCRYAVKFLKENIVHDTRLYGLAARDLAVEAKVLCSILHPNIIKLRGLCSAGELGFSTGNPNGFFLILDRLYDTLEQRIAKWKIEEKNRCKFVKLNKFFDTNKRKTKDIQNGRIRIGLEIAGALKYLHKRNIMYRDLKPENLGFDVRGDIKLFDFGLAKEISLEEKGLDGTYHLTGMVGTLRYMAPEVCKCEMYNLSADVHSFCILFWELLSLTKPYFSFNKKKYDSLVVYGGFRPKICRSFPVEIQCLLRNGWSSNLKERPTFEEIHSILHQLLSSQNNEDIREIYHRRRSTYTMLSKSVLATLSSQRSLTSSD